MAPRRPTRLLDDANKSSAYPRELLANYTSGELTLIDDDGNEVATNPLSTEVSGTGNAVKEIVVNGRKITITKATYLTEHPKISTGTDTTNGSTSPGYGGTFTAIDSVTRDSNGHVIKVNTKTVTMPSAQTSVTGNAGTADKLKTARTISISGGATGSTTFDGSKDVSIDVVVDGSKITGIIPLSSIPKGAQERLVPVTNEAAMLALTSDDIQNGDVVKLEDSGLMYYVVDDTKLGTMAAFSVFTAGAASSVPWTGVTGKPSITPKGTISDASITPTGTVNATFNGTPVEHNHTFNGTKATINSSFTPAGTVNATFNGTEISHGHSFNGTPVEHNHTFNGTPVEHNHTFNGTKATINSSFTPAGTVNATFNGTPVEHNHTFNGTPVEHNHTFNGTPVEHNHTFNGTKATINSSFTPAGTVGSSTPTGKVNSTFNGSAVTSTAPSGNTTFNQITGLGSLPTMSASVTNRCLKFAFSQGALPSSGSVTVASSVHTHNITAAGTVASTFTGDAHSHSFSGNAGIASAEYTPAGTIANKSIIPAGTIGNTSITPAGTIANKSITPAGTISATFNGNAGTASASYTPAGTIANKSITPAGTIANKSIIPAGTISNTSITPAGTISATFNGNAGTASASYTPAGTIANKSITPAGTVNATFNGNDVSHNHTFNGNTITFGGN